MSEKLKEKAKLKPEAYQEITSILESSLGGSSYANALSCIGCGLCYAKCPSGEFTAFTIFKIIRLARLGLLDKVLPLRELWMCTTCYTCQDSCPYGVAVTDNLRAIRNLAFKSGFARPQHVAVAKNVFETGHTIPYRESDAVKRRELGLPEPPTTLKFSEALKQVRKLLFLTGFQEVLEQYGGK